MFDWSRGKKCQIAFFHSQLKNYMDIVKNLKIVQDQKIPSFHFLSEQFV